MNADTGDHIAACMELFSCADHVFEYACWDERQQEEYALMVGQAQHHLEYAMEAVDAGRPYDLLCEKALRLAQQIQHRASVEFCPHEILMLESHMGSIVTLLASIMTTPSDDELERIFASPKVGAEFDALFPH